MTDSSRSSFQFRLSYPDRAFPISFPLSIPSPIPPHSHSPTNNLRLLTHLPTNGRTFHRKNYSAAPPTHPRLTSISICRCPASLLFTLSATATARLRTVHFVNTHTVTSTSTLQVLTSSRIPSLKMGVTAFIAAIVALSAFAAGQGMFMFAFVVVCDQDGHDGTPWVIRCG